jgi:hypothetical protein
MKAWRKLVSSLSGVAWAVSGLLPLSSCSARKRAELTWTWSLPSREIAREEAFWSLVVLAVILLMRCLLMRVFSAGFGRRSTPGPKLGRSRGPGAGGPGYPGIQNTDSSPREPGPRMRPLEGTKGQGPPKAAGPSNGTRQRAVRGPCEEAEAADTWHDRSWRDEMAADAAVPGASNRHDGASLRCKAPRQCFDSRVEI